MRSDLFAIGLTLLLGSAGCATSQFDQHFEARRFAAAARAFDNDPSLHDRERALFRAGVVHALPGSPAYDPHLARTLLERLILLYPESSRRDEATRLLGFLAKLERLEEDARRRESQLQRDLEESTAEIAHLRREIGWLEARIEVQQWHGNFLRRSVERLEADLKDKEREVQALRDELSRLKEIDLQQQSGTNRGPPATNRPPGANGSSTAPDSSSSSSS